MGPEQLLQKIAAIDIEEEAAAVLRRNTELMADLNAAQLAQGIKTDGSPILPPYRPLTVQLKRGLPGLAGVTSRVTLFHTGDHYRQLYAIMRGRMLEYGSYSPLSGKLEAKYGTSRGRLYGLTDESRRELIESHLRPQLYEAIRSKLNG